MTSYQVFRLCSIFFLINTWVYNQLNVLVLTHPLEEENFSNDISDTELQSGVVDLGYDDILRTSDSLLREEYTAPQKWSNGTVPYKFAGNFLDSQKNTIKEAMDLIKNKTNGCIQFVKRTSEQEFLGFLKNEGCKSFVGYMGGPQAIWLDDGCFSRFGTILHEMFHALGFNHEHVRPDRDDYIYIVWENTDGEKDLNSLNKMGPKQFGYLAVPYDYDSVMHYDRYVFSKNGDPTILTKDKAYAEKIGQRSHISTKDLQKLKEFYNCA